jgi:Tfp pilus assembly pilus retraction ATPase PilT
MSSTAKALEQLSSSEYESLVFSILNREGYMNCTWHARKGDDVRDIVCYRFTVDGPPELFQKVVVLCKPDKASLSKYRLAKDVEQLRQYAPFCAIFASNDNVSDYKKKVLTELEQDKENPFTVQVWEPETVVELVEKHQDIRCHYMGIEIDGLYSIPAIQNILTRYQVAKLSENAEALLMHAYERCINDSIPLTNTGLLASFLEKKEDIVKHMVANDSTLNDQIRQLVKEVLEHHAEIDFPEDGVKLTDAFVKTVVLADRLAKVIQRSSVDENLLLYSLFKISNSNAIKLLIESVSAEAVQSMEGALFGNFDIDEQDNIKRFFQECSRNDDLANSSGPRAIGDNLDFGSFDFCLDDLFEEDSTGTGGGLFVVNMATDTNKSMTDPPGADRTDPFSSSEEIEIYQGEISVESDFGSQNVWSGAGFARNRTPAPGRWEAIPSPGKRYIAPITNYLHDMDLDNWFSRILSDLLSAYKKLSDIFIFPERPIQIKSEGKLFEAECEDGSVPFSHFQAEAIACMLLNKSVVKGLLANTRRQQSISFLYQMKGHQAFRVTIMTHAVGVSIAFRKIYPTLWSGENLYFNDPLLSTLVEFEEGVVVVAGKPGSGKTTFLNAMVNEVNQKTCATIVTMENPIETVHAPAGSSILQMQKGIHFSDYRETAVLSAKSGADLIVVGELEDEATCQACFDQARSGLLVVASINAGSCREAYDRMLHLCRAEKDAAFKSFLAKTVKRIVYLKAEVNEEEQFHTAFEVVDLAREIHAAEEAETFETPPEDAAQKAAVPAIDARIDAAFRAVVYSEPSADPKSERD